MFKIIDNRNTSHLIRRWDRVIVVTICFLAFGQLLPAASAGKKFHLEEATIADIHRAIGGKQTSCTKLIQLYINRAKAYNGVCTKLVTADGAPIPPATGYVRAGSPIVFPTDTVPISSVLPNFDQYIGTPMDFGRMDTTISDPSVQTQFGMRVGIPNAGQLNALETLNIRGERSVTCKGGLWELLWDTPIYCGH